MSVQAEALLSFAAVARLGSLTAAARERNLSQPALSAQLKHLTSAIGEPLLTRHRLGMHLTPAGEALLPHASDLARALASARHFAEEFRGLKTGTLRIAASNTLAAYLLPAALRDFHRQYPQVGLEVSSGNSDAALSRLWRGEADIALIEQPLAPLPEGYQAVLLGHDHLILVGSPEHPLTRAALSLAELAALPLIQREQGSGTREVAQEALAQAGLLATPLLELAGNEAVKEAVLSGLGFAFLSEYCVKRELELGLLLAPALPLSGLKRDFNAIIPSTPTNAARTFLESWSVSKR